jgi:hypothetical protein
MGYWKDKHKWSLLEKTLQPIFTSVEARSIVFWTQMIEMPVFWLMVALISFYFRALVVHRGLPWKIYNSWNFYNIFIGWVILNIILELIVLFWFHWALPVPRGWNAWKWASTKTFVICFDQREWYLFSQSYEKCATFILIDCIILIAALCYKKRLYTFEEEEEAKKTNSKWYLFWKEEPYASETPPAKKDTVKKEKKIVRTMYMGTEPYAFIIRLSLIHVLMHICVLTESFFVLIVWLLPLLFLFFNTIRKFGHYKNVKNSEYGYDPRLIHSCYHQIPRSTPDISKKLYCYDTIDKNWINWKIYRIIIFFIFVPLLWLCYLYVEEMRITSFQPFQLSSFHKLHPNYSHNTGEERKLMLEYINLITVLLVPSMLLLYFLLPLWFLTEKRPYESVEVSFYIFGIIQAFAFQIMRKHFLTLFKQFIEFMPVYSSIFFILVLIIIVLYKAIFRPDIPWTPIILYAVLTIIEVLLYAYCENKFFKKFFRKIIKPWLDLLCS